MLTDEMLITFVCPIKNISGWEKNIMNNLEILSKYRRLIEVLFVIPDTFDSSVAGLERALTALTFNTRFCTQAIDEPGIYGAMNSGIAYSKGMYLAFLGADDALVCGGLHSLIAFLHQNMKSDIVLAEAALSVDTNLAKQNGNPIAGGRAGRIHWLLGMPRIHQAIFYRKMFIAQHKVKYLTSIKIASDYVFTSLMIAKGATVSSLESCVVIYSIDGYSSSFHVSRLYVEHLLGFLQCKGLRKFSLVVALSRFLMYVAKQLKLMAIAIVDFSRL
jgi:glycosyltransferase involved in cell wall biosynthesis